MVLAGFGGAMIWVPAPGIAGSAVHVARRGLAIGLTGSGVGVGVVASSGLTALVHAVAGPGAWRPVWGDRGGAVRARRGGGGAVAAPAVAPVPGPVRISALRAVPGWIGSTLSYGGYGLAIAIYMTFLVAAYEDDAGFGTGHASGVFALAGVCITAGGILLGRWSDAVGRRAAMTWAYVGMTVAILLVPVGAEPWAVLSAVVFGLAMSGAPAVLAAHLADRSIPAGSPPRSARSPSSSGWPSWRAPARRVDRRADGDLRSRSRPRLALGSARRRDPARAARAPGSRVSEPSDPDPARRRAQMPWSAARPTLARELRKEQMLGWGKGVAMPTVPSRTEIIEEIRRYAVTGWPPSSCGCSRRSLVRDSGAISPGRARPVRCGHIAATLAQDGPPGGLVRG